MKKWVSFGVVLGLLFVCSTCENPMISDHDGTTTNTNMDTKRITVHSLKGTYLIGETEVFTATLKNTDGSTVPITDGTWSSEFSDVAIVDNTGLVTGTGEGYIYIACAYQGITGSKAIRVMGDYRGSWTGTYSIDGCTCSEDFCTAGFCNTQAGSGYPIEFHLEMEKVSHRLQGRIHLGSLSTTLVDRPELDMIPILEGCVYSAPYIITIYITPEWTDSGPSFQSMLLEYKGYSMNGSARVSCTISSLTKTGD